MGAIVYAAFFAALIAMPIYGGAAYDKNGYRPFKAPIPIIAKRWDANITAFSIQLVILAAGLLAVGGGSAGLPTNQALRETHASGFFLGYFPKTSSRRFPI